MPITPVEKFRQELRRLNTEPDLQASDFQMFHPDRQESVTVFLVRDPEAVAAVRILLSEIAKHRGGTVES